MASNDEWVGSGSVDPAFAELFRAESLPSAPAEAIPEAEPQLGPPAGPEAELEPAAAPSVAESGVDTGRLFRSQGVKGGTTAVLALTSDHGGRLRTLARIDADASVDALPVRVPLPTEQPLGHPAATPDDGTTGDEHQAEVPVAATSDSRPARRTPRARSDQGGLTALAVYGLIIGVTLIVAFVNALVASGDVGWPTGVALLAVTVYCAMKVRREDDTVAIITPPIAFFLAAMTAAQLFLGSAERSLLNRAVVAFFTLADNWFWIIGATVAAVVIVIVRRRRA